ncbi:putative rhomboid protease YdcA [Geobacter sp. OR-1]|uniref:rhomboid family intramembrane serine protease n=1 Tax=Geobacter sp. OR-1 TaxID=1266765 RepID=UPI0005419810|nr:rhomboid family intramembrane serine protease [Geobacter sp. OR-1]GAM11356.1 putative rhomboid protease YdcA [Geobacter sp. OR-1]
MAIETEQDETQNREWVSLHTATGRWGYLTALSRRRADTWALVLESQQIPSRIERYGILWHLMVPQDRLDDALNQLSLYESENLGWPPPPPKPNPLVENTLATLSVLVLLATFHNITGITTPILGHLPPDWTDIGSAKAARILDGEWWRLITALTLHVNWLHLLSNLAIGGLFIIFLCRELGSGLAWSLLLASGALGNLANAHFHLPTHTSVGSSTLIFGGVGLLSAINAIRYRHHLKRRWYTPMAGAMALLASLGTEGNNTDLGAHFFGFAFGMLLGLATGYLLEKHGRPGKGVNRLLALLSSFTVTMSWWAAIKFGG